MYHQEEYYQYCEDWKLWQSEFHTQQFTKCKDMHSTIELGLGLYCSSKLQESYRAVTFKLKRFQIAGL